MRTQLASLFMVLGCALVACGGDDGGGSGIDAQVTADAPVTPDAPAASALGQICNQSTPCPAAAPACLTLGGAANGFCSLLCHADAMFMTNAQGQPASGTDLTADNGKCTAIFSGTVGTATCALPVNRTPTGNLAPNTTYTFQAHCAIACGTGNTCPTGLTCNQGICAP